LLNKPINNPNDVISSKTRYNIFMALEGVHYINFFLTLGGLYLGEILMLPMGGLHVRYAVQRGIWVPTQHLLNVHRD
jgi:hypothetical protein